MAGLCVVCGCPAAHDSCDDCDALVVSGDRDALLVRARRLRPWVAEHERERICGLVTARVCVACQNRSARHVCDECAATAGNLVLFINRVLEAQPSLGPEAVNGLWEKAKAVRLSLMQAVEFRRLCQKVWQDALRLEADRQAEVAKENRRQAKEEERLRKLAHLAEHEAPRSKYSLDGQDWWWGARWEADRTVATSSILAAVADQFKLEESGT